MVVTYGDPNIYIEPLFILSVTTVNFLQWLWKTAYYIYSGTSFIFLTLTVFGRAQWQLFTQEIGDDMRKTKSIFYKWYWDLIIISTNDILFYPACLLKIEEELPPLPQWTSIHWQDPSIKEKNKNKTITMWCCWCQNQALSPSFRAL